jgi:hypothetical protein
MLSKRCFSCLCEKPLGEFYRHSMMGDGHLNKCKDCTKADVRANRVAKLKHYREFDRLRAGLPHRVAARKAYAASEAGKLKVAAATRAWNEKNKYKRSATVTLNNAVRDGRATKLPCLVCGAANTEAHHPSYALPLDVVWLCDEHHKQLHKEVRQYERETESA